VEVTFAGAPTGTKDVFVPEADWAEIIIRFGQVTSSGV
jgi:hypothetical protein